MESKQSKNKMVQSFGIIPIFKDKDGFKVLILKNIRGKNWGFPKGGRENEETPIETAKRELHEEANISDIEIDPEITFLERYSFNRDGKTYDKTNLYFLGYTKNMDSRRKQDEIDEIKWTTFDEARKILSFKDVIRLANDVEKYLIQKSQ